VPALLPPVELITPPIIVIEELSGLTTPNTDGVLTGISAAHSARNVGAVAEPVHGPANTKFAVWLAFVTVSVPAEVTGELVTVNSDGIDRPTLVTTPAPVNVKV
jgi:hypothetical protein